MLIFKKENPKSYTNIEFEIHIENGQYYSFGDEELNIGHFYCTETQSVGSFKDSSVLIFLRKSTFVSRQYDVRNLNNKALVGHVTISNDVARKSLKTTIDVIHQELYDWEVLNSSRGFSLFPSRTWSKFSARIVNHTEGALFSWDYKSSGMYGHKLEHLPVTGQIEMTNPQNHFLLFIGLFLMEMELQLKAID